MNLKLKNINEVLVKHRMNSSSICPTNYPRGELFQDIARKFYYQRIEKEGDDYDIFDEEEIMSIPTKGSLKRHLKSMLGFSIKNGNMDQAKKYYEEYKDKIDFKTRIIYKIFFRFPIIYRLRLRIKFFIRAF